MIQGNRTILDTLIYKGMKIVSLNEETGEAVLSLEVIEDMINPNGVIHGGMTFTLADFCAGSGCFALGYRVATMQASVNYIKAAPCGRTLLAKSRIIHSGRRSIVCVVDIYDNEDNLILSGNFTMAVLEKLDKNIIED